MLHRHLGKPECLDSKGDLSQPSLASSQASEAHAKQTSAGAPAVCLSM